MIDDWCEPGRGGARVFILSSSHHPHVRLPPPLLLDEHDTWVPRQTEPHVSVRVPVSRYVERKDLVDKWRAHARSQS